MLSVAILGNDLEYCKNLINYLNKKNNCIKIVAVYNSIEEFNTFLQRNFIDIIIMNIEVCEYDKILKNKFVQQHFNSIIFILNSKISKEKYKQFNGYVANKNDYDNICNLLNNLTSYKAKQKYIDFKNTNKELVIQKIKKELKLLKAPVHCKGTKYLIEAVYILYELNSESKCNLEKDIYSIIAQKHKKTVNNIKSNIYYAVNTLECEEETLRNYLKECNLYKTYKTSPKKIVIAILKRIKDNNTQLSKTFKV